MTDKSATVTIKIHLPDGEMPNGISLVDLSSQCPENAHLSLDLGGAHIGLLPSEDERPLTSQLTSEELRLIRGALIANATMLTAFGSPKPYQLEMYRKLRNLADRLGDEVGVPEELV